MHTELIHSLQQLTEQKMSIVFHFNHCQIFCLRSNLFIKNDSFKTTFQVRFKDTINIWCTNSTVTLLYHITHSCHQTVCWYSPAASVNQKLTKTQTVWVWRRKKVNDVFIRISRKTREEFSSCSQKHWRTLSKRPLLLQENNQSLSGDVETRNRNTSVW